MVQEERSDIFMPLSGRKVKRGVPRGGCSVGRRSLLQQLLHYIRLPQPGRDVERGLVILNARRKRKVSEPTRQWHHMTNAGDISCPVSEGHTTLIQC